MTKNTASAGVNFTNMFMRGFYATKKTLKSSKPFALVGSARVIIATQKLVKLNQVIKLNYKRKLINLIYNCSAYADK